MDLNKHFLQEDIYDAEKELECIGFCLLRAIEHLEDGYIDIAHNSTEHAMRSLKALITLSKKKKHEEILESVVNKIKQNDIDVETLRNRLNGGESIEN